MFSQNQKPHPTQHNSPPWSDSHTHAALVLRTPSQLPAQEGPWLSCTELCEPQISEPACPRAQDIVLQSKETCSSFLSPCRRLMLLPYFLLAEMVSHPKRRGGHKLPLFFSARSSHRAPASCACGLFWHLSLQGRDTREHLSRPLPNGGNCPTTGWGHPGLQAQRAVSGVNQTSTLKSEIGRSVWLPEVSGPADRSTWRW